MPKTMKQKREDARKRLLTTQTMWLSALQKSPDNTRFFSKLRHTQIEIVHLNDKLGLPMFEDVKSVNYNDVQ